MTPKQQEHYDKSMKIVEEGFPPVYEEYWPINMLVTEAGAIKFNTLEQSGSIIYESRDQTHFILRCPKLYDLLQPQEYEHSVSVYNPDKGSWFVQFYGREVECRGFVIRWQEKHYGFDYTKFQNLTLKIKAFEAALKVNSEHIPEEQCDAIQNMIDAITRSIRIKLELPLDSDLPAMTLNEALEADGQRNRL